MPGIFRTGVSNWKAQKSNLLFPILKLLNKIVVSFGNLGDLTVHTSFEMNVILPCFVDFSSEGILFPNHFIQMPHADFGHNGLFLVPLEDSCHARIASGLFANVIDHIYHRILIPPFRVLDTFHLTTHHLQSERTK